MPPPDTPVPIGPVTLSGAHVGLVPLSPGHCAALATASADGALSRLWYTSVPSPGGKAAEIARRLLLQADGMMVPFAVLDALGEAVGMTTFCNIDHANRRVEIGHTWYAARVQRTGLNTEAKLLLLSHAFGTLGCIAVEFRTHVFNQQSRRAIERLGARLDGILRHHVVGRDGVLRDTCVYSVIAPDWPAMRAHLRWQLERRGRFLDHVEPQLDDGKSE